MKRLLAFVPVLLLAMALQAQQPNIYAYGLKSELVDGNEYKFTYSLNTDAVSGSINIIPAEGATVNYPATEASYLTKGTHEVTIDLGELTKGTYTWSVTATGSTTGAEPAAVSIDAPLTLERSRGLVIDNDFESPHFGQIYVTSSGTTDKGLYLLGADFANPSTAYTTGWSSSAASPLRVVVGEDHLVYITDWSDNPTSGVYVWDPADPAAEAVSVFGGTVGASGISYDGETIIHGSVSHCYVEGTGENRKLYTFDEDVVVSGVDNKMCMFRYDIGSLSQPWVAGPSAVIFPNTAKYEQNGNSMIYSDQKGGWWISQDRATDAATIPALIHVNAAGTVDYNSSGALGGRTRGALALNADQSLVATIGTNYIRIWDVAWDENDAPSLTQKYEITTTFGDPVYNIIMDVAGNVCALGDNKAFAAWALPKTENAFETPAAATYQLEVTDLTGMQTPSLSNLVFVHVAGNTLNLNAAGTSLTAYAIYSLDGRSLLSEKLNGLTKVEVSISGLQSGAYLIKANTPEGVVTKKFIKD